MTGGLRVVLGRTVDGQPLVQDLTRLPHLMVAGACGSGTTTFLKSLAVSLLPRRSLAELRTISLSVCSPDGPREIRHA
jgi:S-DNA-T family DNA segregation ATPase FtsK/SpoIIIE